MPRKEFEAFTRLDASDVNTYLMDQSVMSFAGTAARGSAITTPVEGMVAYLEDSNLVSIYDSSDWKTSLSVTGGIVQVVSNTKTNTFSASLATGATTPITGLTASITPKSSTNKILVMVNVSATANNGNTTESFGLILKRGATAIGIGDAAGSRTRVTSGGHSGTNEHSYNTGSFTFLDSPNTATAVTYSLDIHNGTSVTRTLSVNQVGSTVDLAYNSRQASTITLLEVSA
jgi:hypothetical protein